MGGGCQAGKRGCYVFGCDVRPERRCPRVGSHHVYSSLARKVECSRTPSPHKASSMRVLTDRTQAREIESMQSRKPDFVSFPRYLHCLRTFSQNLVKASLKTDSPAQSLLANLGQSLARYMDLQSDPAVFSKLGISSAAELVDLLSKVRGHISRFLVGAIAHTSVRAVHHQLLHPHNPLADSNRCLCVATCCPRESLLRTKRCCRIPRSWLDSSICSQSDSTTRDRTR